MSGGVVRKGGVGGVLGGDARAVNKTEGFSPRYRRVWLRSTSVSCFFFFFSLEKLAEVCPVQQGVANVYRVLHLVRGVI